MGYALVRAALGKACGIYATTSLITSLSYLFVSGKSLPSLWYYSLNNKSDLHEVHAQID